MRLITSRVRNKQIFSPSRPPLAAREYTHVSSHVTRGRDYASVATRYAHRTTQKRVHVAVQSRRRVKSSVVRPPSLGRASAALSRPFSSPAAMPLSRARSARATSSSVPVWRLRHAPKAPPRPGGRPPRRTGKSPYTYVRVSRTRSPYTATTRQRACRKPAPPTSSRRPCYRAFSRPRPAAPPPRPPAPPPPSAPRQTHPRRVPRRRAAGQATWAAAWACS